jgi:RNA polymerase sigma-70 factor, ECF subfamily
MTDAELVVLWKGGDDDAYTAIYSKYYIVLRKRAYSIVKNEEAAEDVVQNAMTKAYTKIGQFNGKSGLSTWLTRIVINEGLMYKRRERRTANTMSLNDPNGVDGGISFGEIIDNIDSGAESAEDRLIRDTPRKTLMEALSRLEDSYRLPIEMFELQGLSVNECASAFGISVPALKSRLFRGRAQLKALLKPHKYDLF